MLETVVGPEIGDSAPDSNALAGRKLSRKIKVSTYFRPQLNHPGIQTANSQNWTLRPSIRPVIGNASVPSSESSKKY